MSKWKKLHSYNRFATTCFNKRIVCANTFCLEGSCHGQCHNSTGRFPLKSFTASAFGRAKSVCKRAGHRCSKKNRPPIIHARLLQGPHMMQRTHRLRQITQMEKSSQVSGGGSFHIHLTSLGSRLRKVCWDQLIMSRRLRQKSRDRVTFRDKKVATCCLCSCPTYSSTMDRDLEIEYWSYQTLERTLETLLNSDNKLV